MSETVTLPLWLFVVVLLFAAITALSHVFIPPVRWFLRRRLERAVSRLNRRLVHPIEPFKLLRRQDTILRLSYDPSVIEAVQTHAAETGIREDVAHSIARQYAREIVPSFSASAYFGFATRAARWLSTRLFDVEVSRAEETPGRPDATVVFVMNHRSNMDYVLVTYLAAERSALAYAVGEWARIWPLSRLFRAMGAYFIRRRSRNILYRRVLARYVQMAVAGGVTQAIFPEGGLSLDGRVGAPRLGLLSYICDGYDPAGREIVFVPVSLNYDRVIEDNILLAAGRDGSRRFRGSFPTAMAFTLRWLWRRLRGRVRKFGVAAVSFGAPIPLSDYGPDPDVKKLAVDIMARIRADVPVLAGPLVAETLLTGTETQSSIVEAVAARVAAFEASGHFVRLGGTVEEAVERMLRMFVLRHMVRRVGERVEISERGYRVLPFYAAAIPTEDAALQNMPQGSRSAGI